MRLKDCHNFRDFRRLAEQRLPSPIFNYIDGGADDEVTMRRNTAAFEACDLVPSVLRGVTDVDLSVTGVDPVPWTNHSLCSRSRDVPPETGQL